MHPFFKSFTYAYKGLKVALSQRNMKVHVACALLVMVLGFIFHITSVEWCIISLCIGLVIAFEMINTAIEYLVDMISLDFNEKAGNSATRLNLSFPGKGGGGMDMSIQKVSK